LNRAAALDAGFAVPDFAAPDDMPRAGEITQIDLTLGRWLRIWWLFHWRLGIGSVAIALFVLALPNNQGQYIALTALALGLMAWSFLAMTMALQKSYHGFRLGLVADSGEVPLTPGRVLCVWWLYAWRNATGLLLLSLPQGIAMAAVGQYTDHNSAWRVLDLFWTFAVMYIALRKRYRGFRIVLMAA
jgi:hypothetical protein